MSLTPNQYKNKVKEIAKQSYDIAGFGNEAKTEIPFYTQRNKELFLLNKALNADIPKFEATEDYYNQYPLLNTQGVVKDGQNLTELPSVETQVKDFGIDWISLTMPDIVFFDYTTKELTDTDRYNAIVRNVSHVLTDIMGFGVSHANPTGRNFYDASYTLEHNAGLVCIGGQNNTVMITINGTGCTYGKKGWEGHLHAWLSLFAPMANITRIDLVKDLINSDKDIYWFDKQDDLGGFSFIGRKPKVERRGNWKRPDGKGLTLYIGSRESSKFCRIYEKGKQLGDKYSNWLRVEVELKQKTVHIDFDVLLHPAKYFLACYPCFQVFNVGNIPLNKLENIQRENLISFEKALEITRNQFGRYLYAFRDIVKDDTKLLDMLTDIDNKSYPERLDKLTIPPMSHNNL